MKTVLITLGLLVACSSAVGEQQNPIVIENTHVRYTISPEGRIIRRLECGLTATATDRL